MDSSITKNDIIFARKVIKSYNAYDTDDSILEQCDGKYNHLRMAATSAKEFLLSLNINPYDDNDYGNITE